MTEKQEKQVKRELRKKRSGEKGQPMTQLDRIRSFYAFDEPLNEKDEAKRLKLHQVFSKLSSGMPRGMIIKQLIKDESDSVSSPTAYKLINEALELYGDLSATQKQGMRVALAEQYMTLANIARKDGQLDTWKKALDSYAKLLGLNDMDSSPQMRVAPIIMNFTTDPKALQETAVEIDAEDL